MKAPKRRLDVLVVERGLAPTRTKAQAMILAGQVVVDDHRVDKPGTLISEDAELRLKGEVLKFVSRGGYKLEAALEQLNIDVQGKRCADIGASTGGFTDCLLQRGATHVYAIDVGRGQLHPSLQSDARVVSREQVNARYLTEAELPELVDVMVVDVSFISLRQVLPSATARLKNGGVLIALIKPQFEAGRELVEKGGVVRDETARVSTIENVAQFIVNMGFEQVGLLDSPIRGPAGNLEALMAARKR